MRRRWRVDVYYSGFTTVEVMAGGEEEAIRKGREEAHKRLARATVLDEDGSLCQLLRSLEPWTDCDAAEPMEQTATKVYAGRIPSTSSDLIHCSSCGQEFLQFCGDRFDFCPGCGAEFIEYAEPVERSHENQDAGR